MNLTAVTASHWQISTHLNGEVLTARVNADDADVYVMGVPAGFTAAEVEGWLRDLLGVARETSRHDTGDRPIPILLHHILTGLLFSHAELWDRAGGTLACSCVFVRTRSEVSFGWVGERDPVVQIRGETKDVGWVRVRDDEGREARAFAIDAEHPLSISWMWPSELDAESEGRSAELTAQWVVVREGSTAPDHAGSTHEPPPNAPVSAFEAAPPRLEAAPLPPELPTGAEAVAWSGPPRLDSPVSAPTQAAAWSTLVFLDPAASDAPGLAFETPAAAHAPEARTVEIPPLPPPVLHAPREPADDMTLPDLTSAPMPPASGAAPEYGGALETEPDTMEMPLPPAPVRSRSPSAGWSDVYESEPGPVDARPGRSARGGVLGWLTGLLGPLARRRQDDGDAELFRPRQSMPVAAPMTSHAHPSPTPPAAHAVRVSDTAPAPRVAPAVRPSPSTVARAVAANAARPMPVAPPAAAMPVPDVAPAMPAEPAPPAVPGVASRPAAVAHEIDLAPHAPPAPHASPAPPQAAMAEPVAPHAIESAADEVDPFEFKPVTSDARAPRVPRRPPLRPAWTEATEMRGEMPLWKKPWVWVAVVLALFAGGWLVGAMQGERSAPGAPNIMTRALRGVGLGGSRYEVTINSRPPGAWIAVGGKDLARRTPATVELPPGEHHVTLSFSDLGSAGYTIRGERGDRLSLDAALWGSLAVRGSDMSLPISVSVDGKTLGFAPVQMDSVLPGPHDVRFSGPGMPSWSQTVTVRVGELSEVLARPMTSPATGVIEVRASAAGGDGAEPITGATVFVDGARRGSTPLTLELSRGPHSVRVEHQGEQAPVQVIDLPGGNQRFATFEFGLDIERPSLQALAPPARIAIDRPATISSALLGVGTSEVREMWLHVRTPEDTWRRYQMVMMKATGGVVGVAVFPPTMFDGSGRARWYVSATTQAGDEYFTEIQGAEMQAPSGPIRR